MPLLQIAKNKLFLHGQAGFNLRDSAQPDSGPHLRKNNEMLDIDPNLLTNIPFTGEATTRRSPNGILNKTKSRYRN